MKIAVINGPNLNFLGIREPHIYGNTTLKELEESLVAYGHEKGSEVICFQSNCEGSIIDFIQKCYHEHVQGMIINPGAYTHYSYAISDAIKSVTLPVIEVHISNIYKREDFRKTSVTAESCMGIVGGFGLDGYFMALDALIKHL
ncbi:MAG: type II 3-dehydroquinate dehydratase [Cellulosilyticaceae bacterium]